MQSISIIVATYNSAKTLSDTLESLSLQNIPDLEVLVQDGGSTDDTLSIAARYDFVDVKSEKDKGLYDAMNRGIMRAKGDIIGILNSDDFYPENTILKRVQDAFSKDPDLEAVYGDLKYVEMDNVSRVIRHWKSGPYKKASWLRGWMPPHPTFFVRRDVYERFDKFNDSLQFAADYEFMLRCCFKNNIKVGYIPEVLVHMRAGGISNSSFGNRLSANKEDRLAWKLNEMKVPVGLAVLKPLRKASQWFGRNKD